MDFCTACFVVLEEEMRSLFVPPIYFVVLLSRHCCTAYLLKYLLNQQNFEILAARMYLY